MQQIHGKQQTQIITLHAADLLQMTAQTMMGHASDACTSTHLLGESAVDLLGSVLP